MNETSAVLRQARWRVWLLVAAGLFAGSASMAGVGEVCSANRPCVAGEVCVLPDGTCDQPEAEGLCEVVPETCPGPFDPVCGCDAMTYDNRCEALMVGVNVAHPGACAMPCGGVAGTACDAGEFCSLPPAMCGTPNLEGFCAPVPDSCPGTFDPVCGCDGVTYDNPCFADAAGAQIDHDGPCVVACGGLTGVTCDSGEFCLFLDGACAEPDTEGICAPTPQDCPAVFEPVCGCDGVTYDNRCLAEMAGAPAEHEGPCAQVCGGVDGTACQAGEFCKLPADQCDVPDLAGVCQPIPQSCPIVFDPVCGCDGVTYDNACEADLVAAQIGGLGECPPGCESQSDCTSEEFCSLPDGGCGTQGTCDPRPDVCPLVFEPVCGCDGSTYANRCLAESAGVSVDREGSCEPPCGGITGASCPVGELCVFPDDTCDDTDVTGACLPTPQACPATFEPVCGCDGETYVNRCEAWVAGTRVGFDGACSPVCGGIAGIPCGADEFCNYPVGTCDVADDFGVCEPVPVQCPETCALACGCDGVTYANECLASAAGVSLDSQGDCDPAGRLIRGVRFDTTGDMRWQAASAALSYNVYREVGVAPPSSYAGECFAAALPLAEANVAESPQQGEMWLFQVTGLSRRARVPWGSPPTVRAGCPPSPAGSGNDGVFEFFQQKRQFRVLFIDGRPGGNVMKELNGKIGLYMAAIFLASLGFSTMAADAVEPMAAVRVSGEQIAWSSQVENNGFTLTVSGQGVELHREYRVGETLTFSPVDDQGNLLPDGTYNWELRANRQFDKSADSGMNNGRPGEEVRDAVQPAEVGTAGSRELAQSGTFTIADRAIVDPNLPEPEPVASRQAQSSGKPGRAGSDADGVEKDQNILDDLIVDGSLCVGFDCVNGESFGFDTLRLKENNTRLHFFDTSSSASFPTNDWRLVANDSTNGGANKFSIEDASAGRVPFTVEAGARSNALYVEDGGRVGLGTSTPVVELHVVDGDTPTMRLEQNGSSGFQAQTWDVAGNEAGFFVRDVTNGSKLSFRIQPGSPSESIFIKTDRVHIKGPIEPWHVVVYKASGLADTDDIDHVAEADFSSSVTAVSCTSDDATTSITMEKNGTAFASGCTCDGTTCFSGNEAFGAGDKLDFELGSTTSATRVSVHLKRSGT